MPSDETRRVRTSPWTVTALNLVEPATDTLADLDLLHAGEPWALARRPIVVEAVQERLVALLEWLDGRDHLEEVHHGGSADDHRPPHSAA